MYDLKMRIFGVVISIVICLGLEKTQCRKVRRSSGDSKSNIIGKYATFQQIKDWIYEQQSAHPDLVTVEDIGTTSERNTLLLMKIGYPSQDKHIDKPIVWVDSGIHAREWISHAALLYALDKILSGSDSTYRSLLETVDLYALPVVNPDGYEYTWSTNRMWRKNRRDNSGVTTETEGDDDGDCNGVDLNRNWDVDWEDLDYSSPDPCREVYHGPSPMSEPEVKAISKFILKNKHNINASVHLHSFAQMIMHCYGYKKGPVKGRDDEKRLAKEAAAKILELTGVVYQTGGSADILYKYSGGMADWMALKAGVPIAITMELRDSGEDGSFILPASEIHGTGKEVLVMVEGAMEEVAKQYTSET